jgi:eukaryotic-like serine/threonine-protein kinase
LTTARTVTTIQGKRYRLARELGRGGQGAVFAVQGGRLAVKLFDARSGMQQERLRDQLAMVGRFPLAGLPLARPSSPSGRHTWVMSWNMSQAWFPAHAFAATG